MKNIIAAISTFLDSLPPYRWCKENSAEAHILLSIVLSISFSVARVWLPWQLAIAVSLLFCSTFYFGKEYFDQYRPNGTGFDWGDIKIDYVAWVVGVAIQNLVGLALKFN